MVSFNQYNQFYKCIAAKFDPSDVEELLEKYGVLISSKYEDGEIKIYCQNQRIKTGDWIVIDYNPDKGFAVRVMTDSIFRLFLSHNYFLMESSSSIRPTN